MVGISFMELLLVLVLPVMGLAGLVVLFFVVRAAVSAGNRDNTEGK